MVHFILLALGLIGNLGFGFAACSLAWATWRDGKSSTPTTTSWLFFISALAFGGFLIGTYGFNLLFSVLVIEAIAWSVVLWFTYRPRPEPASQNPPRDASGRVIDWTLAGSEHFTIKGSEIGDRQ